MSKGLSFFKIARLGVCFHCPVSESHQKSYFRRKFMNCSSLNLKGLSEVAFSRFFNSINPLIIIRKLSSSESKPWKNNFKNYLNIKGQFYLEKLPF